jgi:hypothetical protein
MKSLADIPFKYEGAILILVGVLFLVSGADAALSFLSHDAVGETLGVVATLLAAALGIMLRGRVTSG